MLQILTPIRETQKTKMQDQPGIWWNYQGCQNSGSYLGSNRGGRHAKHKMLPII